MQVDQGVAVKISGALSGMAYVASFESTVAELRAEIARLLGSNDPGSLKLICAGRQLQDPSRSLRACGVGPTTRVLVVGTGSTSTSHALASGQPQPPTPLPCSPGQPGSHGGSTGGGSSAAVSAAPRVSPVPTLLAAEEVRAAQLDRIQRVVRGMSARSAATADHGYALELENQAGQRMQLGPADRQAVVMGLMLHDMATACMRQGDWQAAMDRLLLAEESLSLADPSVLDMIDNVGLLLLDSVWCCYKLGDMRRLAVARDRLTRSKAALARAHGPCMERVRALHGGRFVPELAVYVRLETLLGVVAYLTGDVPGAQKLLATAHRKWQALQVSDAQLATLQGMGYTSIEATRALRFSGGGLEAAITFISEQRAAQQEREARVARDAAWRKERRQYGRGPGGDFVDMELLQKLCGLGYDRALAAEALRAADNQWDAALERVLDPMQAHALALAASLQQALHKDKQQEQRRKRARQQARISDTAAAADPAAAGSSTSHSTPVRQTESQPAQSTDELHCGDGINVSEAEADGGDEGEESAARASDEELENEVAQQLTTDPLAAYDIDVRDEGELCATYLALCASTLQPQADAPS